MTSIPVLHSRRSAEARLDTPARGRPNTTLHLMGISLIGLGLGMGATTIVEALSTDRDTAAMLVSTGFSAVLGLALWRTTTMGAVRSRDVFAAVGWTWLGVTLVGAVPYVLAGAFAAPGADLVEQIVNAIFESASGFSGTGSTALTDFAIPGRGLMMYRQATQWYGGLGVLLLAISVLPVLGIGGLGLVTTETRGRSSTRSAPRLSATARTLWKIYVAATVVMFVALFAVPGPSLYDSVALALSATSTGGFSPHAESIGLYDSIVVEIVIMAGMLWAGTNFALHLRVGRGQVGSYRRDHEFRGYIIMVIGASAIVTGFLRFDDGLELATALRVGMFNVVSLATSTGFRNASGPGSAGDFAIWAPAAQIVLLCLLAVGASTGSMAGGLKVRRVQILFAHSVRSVRHSQNPRAILPVKHGSTAVAEDTVSRVAGFFVLYVLLAATGVIVVSSLGADLDASIGGVVGSLGAMGPGLGNAGPTASFSDAFSQPARLVLALLMLIGRLEIVPMLLMLAAPYRALRGPRRRIGGGS